MECPCIIVYTISNGLFQCGPFVFLLHHHITIFSYARMSFLRKRVNVFYSYKKIKKKKNIKKIHLTIIFSAVTRQCQTPNYRPLRELTLFTIVQWRTQQTGELLQTILFSFLPEISQV